MAVLGGADPQVHVLGIGGSRARGASPEDDRGILAGQPYGAGRFRQLGLQADVHVGAARSDAGRGVTLSAGGAAYPAELDVLRPFGEVHAEVRGFVTAPLPLSPVVSVRLGGKRVVGTAPYHEAAYLGGGATLRGFARNRFAGDASVYGGAEIRLALGRASLLRRVIRFGVLGLVDMGRVFADGTAPGSWHAAAGAGFWLSPLGWSTALSVTAARGAEGTRLYVGTGVGF